MQTLNRSTEAKSPRDARRTLEVQRDVRACITPMQSSKSRLARPTAAQRHGPRDVRGTLDKAGACMRCEVLKGRLEGRLEGR